MFEALIHRAANSVESVMLRYAIRAAIAIPFIIAIGFGLAAITLKLSEHFGTVGALSIVGAAFAVIGILSVAALAATEHGATNLEAKNAATPPAEETEAGTSPSPQSDLMLALLGTFGPKAIPAIPAVTRFLVRNWALILSIVSVVVILMMEKRKVTTEVPEPAE